MTPEGRTKAKITKLLKEFDCWYYMPVPGGWGRRTVDYLGLINGRMFAIEAKKAGKDKPTTLQENELNKINGCGGECFFINSEEGVERLRTWLEGVSDSRQR
jgi:hypothetical protein